jgi:hypothetical protein
MECHRHEWDLYYMGARNQHNKMINVHFVLVPRTDNVNVIAQCQEWRYWIHLGQCRAYMMRMDLEPLIYPHLLQWAESKNGKHKINCTIDVYMDKIFDRKGPERLRDWIKKR